YTLTHALSLLKIHHAFFIPATPAILNVTANFFNTALVDEDQLLRDDDLLTNFQDRILAHILEQIPLTAHLDSAVRWSTVTVSAAGVATAFLASHRDRVTEGFDVLGALDGWIGGMGDVLSKLWRKAMGVKQEGNEAFGDEDVMKIYGFVRKELGVVFDRSEMKDVAKPVGVILDAIRDGRLKEVCK
ncbi:hypothetical protein P7C71_g4036, partial [Lecanoromycetidae sp. Uapishka_2]